MNHLIFGAGNLGIDLKNEIIRQSGERRGVEVVSLSEGLDVRNPQAVRDKCLSHPWDVVWYCVGYGSVAQAKENYQEAFQIYSRIPEAIASFVRPETRVIIFSTDYVADENDPSNPQARTTNPLSEYANIRSYAENRWMLNDRPNSAIIRVGSLYGTHKPAQTLPGRLLNAFGRDTESRIRLPRNLVTPTPSLWLASILVANLDKLTTDEGASIHHCAPKGNVSVWDWGTFVLQGIREPSAFVPDEFFDEERPKISALDCDFLEQNWHWSELWKTYFKAEWFMPPEIEEPAPPSPDETPTPSKAKKGKSDKKA